MGSFTKFHFDHSAIDNYDDVLIFHNNDLFSFAIIRLNKSTASTKYMCVKIICIHVRFKNI